jgi:pSer/pThr/pTyr-binding forkhead associated (FHA) protein
MLARLVALDEGADIPVDRALVIVGRHPQCDARIDSIRVSRRHCCVTADNGEVVVRDLGSTNGIRINGQRVEMGRLRPGDELSIAHIRYRLDTGQEHERTLADPADSRQASPLTPSRVPPAATPAAGGEGNPDNPLAAAVRELLPPGVADRCRIQVILQMQPEAAGEAADPCRHDSSP